jgi:hypothetical protein
MEDFISAKKVNKYITASDYKIDHDTLDKFITNLKNKNSRLFRNVGASVQAGGHVSAPSEYYGINSGSYSASNKTPVTNVSSANALASSTRPAIESAQFPLNSSVKGPATINAATVGGSQGGGCGCMGGGGKKGNKGKNKCKCGCSKGKCKCGYKCKCRDHMKGGNGDTTAVSLSESCGVNISAPEPLVDPLAINANSIPSKFGSEGAPNIDNLATHNLPIRGGGRSGLLPFFTQKDAKMVAKHLGIKVGSNSQNYSNLQTMLSMNMTGIMNDLFGQVKNRDRIIGKSHLNKTMKN